MTLSMQNIRHFWFNVQDISLAGLAPKLRQIASIRKKERKRNAMGYLEQVLGFYLRSTVLALGSKCIGVKHYFQTLRFSTITSELFVLQQWISHHRVSLVKTNRAIPNFAHKGKFQNLTSRPIWSHMSDQVKVGHGYHSIQSHKTNNLPPISFVYHLWFKIYEQKSDFPIGL